MSEPVKMTLDAGGFVIERLLSWEDFLYVEKETRPEAARTQAAQGQDSERS